MSVQDQQTERPIYRHIIVKRRGFIEKVASPEQFRRIRAQLEDDPTGATLDDDIKHLYRGDTLKKTMEKVMGWSGRGTAVEESPDGVDPSQVVAEHDAMRLRGDDGPVKYRAQAGVVVATLNKKHIPGGDERLPLTPMVLSHPGFSHSDDPAADFLKAAFDLQAKFRAHSDRKFLLLDKWAQQGVTLVTVAYTPILAAPKADRGLELYCEFHQVTRMGHVDTSGFDVYSDSGEYPISPPNTAELLTMMKSADELAGVVNTTPTYRPRG